MGNYENLKQSITEVIRTNGNQEITGAVLQSTLLTIISTVGANATFAGIATPSTNPGTPDGSVFYLASESGTYSNFGGAELQDGLSILMWDGSWSSQQIFGIDDEPTAGSDNLVKSKGVQEELALGAVYDVSAKNLTAGVNNDGKFESLSVLLEDANLDTLIPISVRKGGMSIKFIQSSDNKYVQARLMANTFTTDVTKWQTVDKNPTPYSSNLVESEGAYNIERGLRGKKLLTRNSENGYVEFSIGEEITVNGLPYYFYLLDSNNSPFNGSVVVQKRLNGSNMGQNTFTVTNGILEFNASPLLTGGDTLRIVFSNGSISVEIADNTSIGYVINDVNKKTSEVLVIDSTNGIAASETTVTKQKVLITTDVIGNYIFNNCDITFVYNGEIYASNSASITLNYCVLSFKQGSYLSPIHWYNATLGVLKKISGNGNRVNGYQCINAVFAQDLQGNYLYYDADFFDGDVNISIFKGCWTTLDNIIPNFRFGGFNKLNNRIIIDVDCRIHGAGDIKGKFVGDGYHKLRTDGNIIAGSEFNNIIFYFSSIVLSDGSYTKFIGCYFLSTKIVGSYQNSMQVIGCEFLGSDARIQLHWAINSIFENNNFRVNDTLGKFPDVTLSDKINGDASRNMMFRAIKNCKITRNHIWNGLIGICSFYPNFTIISNLSNIDEDDFLSSEGNVITDNIIEDCNEEYISFDSSYQYDSAKILSSSLEFITVDTGKYTPNQQTTQKKVMAKVTLNLESLALADYPQKVKELAFMTRGICACNMNTGEYYKLTSFDLVGETALDSENIEYAISGTYQVQIQIPTIYGTQRQLDESEAAALSAYILSKWAAGVGVQISTVIAQNIISNNRIMGIGTDCPGNIETMGGIVLYGMCYNNNITNNFLYNRRIWLLQWANKLSNRVFVNNIVSHNNLWDANIDEIDYKQDNYFEELGITQFNKGNTYVGNILSGEKDKAQFRLVNDDHSTLIGNHAQLFSLRYCTNVKLVANRSDSATLYPPTSYVQDNTNEMALN